MFDFSFLAPCPTSGLVVHGGAGQLIPEANVRKLIDKLQHQRDIVIDYKLVPGANHFFTEHMDELNAEVEQYVATHRDQQPQQEKRARG